MQRTLSTASAASAASSSDPDLRERLETELARQTYECAICMEPVLRQQPIYGCATCFKVLHWACAQQWAKSSAAAVFRCPGCQTLVDALPARSRCFCGKQTDPKWSAGGPQPHSCGEQCGATTRRLSGPCRHPCTDPCHPGPCDACAALIHAHCVRAETEA